MATAQASYLQQRDYLAVAINHFFVDVLNSSRALLMAILAVSIGLSNAQVGLLFLLYSVGNALSQPLFGWLADRIGPRWLVIGGTGWMIIFFTIAATAPSWTAVVALTVAGIGSGAFHPTGTMVASQASVTKRTQATSVFFMSGQMGLFAGPVLAGILLQQFGLRGYVVLPALALIALASAWKWILNKEDSLEAGALPASRGSTAGQRPAHYYRRAILLVLIIFSIGTVSISATNFAPKLFTEMGLSAGLVGLLSGLYMLGSAAGLFVGGTLADRWGGRLVILLAATVSILPVFFYIPAEGAARMLLLLAAGFFVGMPHSVLVLMVQGMFPGRRAMASGLALGFMFFSGSVGSLIVGVAADRLGLATALQYTAFLGLVTVAATLLLPRETREQRAALG